MIQCYGSVTAKHKNSYLHLDCESGNVSSWTNVYMCPTYLLRHKNEVRLIQFENEKFAEEYINEHKHDYDSITKLEGVK